ncbi:MAG TPA: CPBP family intramembrane glutamic endopeptidase [Gemmatimonadales bacterium]
MRPLEGVTPTRIRILAFFLLAYALTWFGNLGNVIHPAVWWPRPMFVLGPILAAPLVIGWTEGRAGLLAWWHRILRFRAPGRIYAAGLLIPLAIIVTSAALAVAAGASLPPIAAWNWGALLVALPIVPLGGPIPEEPAFRGYGQHVLQQTMSPLAASLWIGLGVLVWHLPILIIGGIPWPIAVALPAVSVVYAWLYQAGGSIWPLVGLHFIQNLVGGMLFGAMFDGRGDVVWTGFLAALYVLWALILAWRLGPTLGAAVRTK